ncbi:MAG TPA: EAL domain-containing protein [Magnetospirillum sp.]|nr:EAL domain-containing protein [Magnetospirillum sp.]
MGKALFITRSTAGLDLVPSLLSSAGHEVEVTSDPDYGLTFIQCGRPDMVVCEVAHGIDGYRVLSEIRALPPVLSALPVMLIVDRADDVSRSSGLGRGADEVVPRTMAGAEIAAIADARLRRSMEVRDQLQNCNPQGCSARYHAEMSVFNDIEPAAGLLSLAQLDGLASCPTLWDDDRPPVVMVVGVNRYAAIAATLGNSFGEDLLRAVAARLVAFEPTLGLIAHVGGDTFAALLPPRTALAEAESLAEQLRRAMAQPFTLGGRSLCATVSVGLARGEGALGLAALLARATAAAHHAHALGGNLVFTYHAEQVAREAERLSVAAELRAGIGFGEFRMVYQPKVRLDDGRILGAEALMRWSSRALGPVAPGVFIPVAEDCGLIAELGAFAFRTAAETLAQWRLQPWGAHLTMAVNVSPHQLRHHALVGDLRAVLERTGLPAEAFELEITESAFVGRESEVTDAIAALKAMGFRLSMDDFGTGYSSLSYLHRIPLDVLKIDQSFVRGLPHDAVACGITEAIIAIAGRLGLGIVAEGVETEAQAAFLSAHGVSMAQGMLLARPLCEAEFRTRCQAQQTPPTIG